MLILIPSRNYRVHAFWVSIEKLVAIGFVVDLELFNAVFSFVADKNVKQNEVIETIYILVHCLRFISDLNLTVFVERVFFSEITCLKATDSLVFLHVENSTSKISILHYDIAFVVFGINASIRWGGEYRVHFTLS